MEKKDQGTEAIHLQHGEQHIVGVKSLSVLLSKDDDAWFAQGLEIDYAAAGSSIEEAKENFANGLTATIAEHLKLCGAINKFLKPAPQSAWDEFYAADASSLKQKITTVHLYNLAPETAELPGLETPKTTFPFNEIKFIEPLATA